MMTLRETADQESQLICKSCVAQRACYRMTTVELEKDLCEFFGTASIGIREICSQSQRFPDKRSAAFRVRINTRTRSRFCDGGPASITNHCVLQQIYIYSINSVRASSLCTFKGTYDLIEIPLTTIFCI